MKDDFDVPVAGVEEARPAYPGLSARHRYITNEPEIEGHWTSAAKQTLIVEAIMQVVGWYYLGRTAHFATSHGYYLPYRHYD